MGRPYPLTIFYDGACKVCTRQMERFEKRDFRKRLAFVDISRHFDARKFGFEGQPHRKYIYAKDTSGEVVCGVDAFIWIWQACGENALAWLVGLLGIKQLGKVLYRAFSRFRYRLFEKNGNVCDFHYAKEI